MSKPKYPNITVELVGTSVNPASIIGKVMKALRRAKVSDAEISTFVEEATSGDYDNVLVTVMRWVEVD